MSFSGCRVASVLLLLAFLATAAPLGAQQTIIFPHVAMGRTAEGDDFQTSILVTNLSSQSVSAALNLFDDNGMPLFANINDQTNTIFAVSNFPFNLSPQGVKKLDLTLSPGQNLTSGWARIITSEGGPIGASLVFQQIRAGQVFAQAGVLPTTPAQSFVIFVEKAPGVDTGIAIINPDPLQPRTFNFTLRGENGMAVGTTQPLQLSARGHLAIFASQLIPELATMQTFRGRLEISGAESSVVTLRFNNQQFTTLAALSGLVLPTEDIPEVPESEQPTDCGRNDNLQNGDQIPQLPIIITGVISTANCMGGPLPDLDSFKFPGSPGQVIMISVKTNVATPFAARVVVFDPNQNPIQGANKAGSGEFTLDPITLTVGGTHFLRILPDAPVSGSPTHEYQIVIRIR